jgi:hypothetical protein
MAKSTRRKRGNKGKQSKEAEASKDVDAEKSDEIGIILFLTGIWWF